MNQANPNQASAWDPAPAIKVLDDIEKRSSPFRGQGFEYEKLAVEYSHRGFQTLTYLNGGALVAIPTALAFFKADLGRGAIMSTCDVCRWSDFRRYRPGLRLLRDGATSRGDGQLSERTNARGDRY